MSLLGINSGEFPLVTMGEEEGFKVRGGVLSDLFERTLFSISTSTDETRPQLTGAYPHLQKEIVYLGSCQPTVTV